MRNLAHRWTHWGHFFQIQGFFFSNFQNRTGETSSPSSLAASCAPAYFIVHWSGKLLFTYSKSHTKVSQLLTSSSHLMLWLTSCNFPSCSTSSFHPTYCTLSCIGFVDCYKTEEVWISKNSVTNENCNTQSSRIWHLQNNIKVYLAKENSPL